MTSGTAIQDQDDAFPVSRATAAPQPSAKRRLDQPGTLHLSGDRRVDRALLAFARLLAEIDAASRTSLAAQPTGPVPA
jgi:hypothetical protein